MIGSLSNPACESSDVNLDLVAALVQKIHQTKGEGAILVFVTGWAEISKLNGILTDQMRLRNVQIHPLHSLIPTADQRAIFKRPPKGIRKIVLATNIAETRYAQKTLNFEGVPNEKSNRHFTLTIHLPMLRFENLSKPFLF